MGKIAETIRSGAAVLGIELGSTRIKAVLIDGKGTPLASGGHEWENRLEDDRWTYHLDDVWVGLQGAYRTLADNVAAQYGVTLTSVAALGISGMMHGYLPFDKDGNQIAKFLTWRNTNTERAAVELSERFCFNIPLRWSIAHLYQAMLDGETHLNELDFFTTLAGYVHWKLTGKNVLGVGDASGMFPIGGDGDYDAGMVASFNKLIADKGYDWNLRDLLPRVLTAGDDAGTLTADGAALLDPTGGLQAGIPMCPPEGDAGTGMVATGSVSARTGNVSAGTSIFAMVVLERELSKAYPEIDIATTPDGTPVAMVHANNCSSDIDAWLRVFAEFSQTFGVDIDKSDLYSTLYRAALDGDTDGGGLLAYNYLSGETLTGFDIGRPLFCRLPDAKFSLQNFMRTLLYSAVAALKTGMDILDTEKVALDSMTGHGGFFKTPLVGQRIMAAALGVPVTVNDSAGEGGAWGIALLAAYMRGRADGQSLGDYLNNVIFTAGGGSTVAPDSGDVDGFARFMKRYTDGFAIERAATEFLN